MNNNSLEIITTFILIGLTIFLLNPWHFWMPDMMMIGGLISLFLAFAIFSGFVLREKVYDERDRMHQALAGRFAFLAGTAVLLLGIMSQGLDHAVDPWLVGALAAMLIAKIVTRWWSDRHL